MDLGRINTIRNWDWKMLQYKNWLVKKVTLENMSRFLFQDCLWLWTTSLSLIVLHVLVQQYIVFQKQIQHIQRRHDDPSHVSAINVFWFEFCWRFVKCLGFTTLGRNMCDQTQAAPGPTQWAKHGPLPMIQTNSLFIIHIRCPVLSCSLPD